MKAPYNTKTKEGWIDDQLNRSVGYLERPGQHDFHLYIASNGVGLWLTKKQVVQLKALLDEYCMEEQLCREPRK